MTDENSHTDLPDERAESTSGLSALIEQQNRQRSAAPIVLAGAAGIALVAFVLLSGI